MFDVLRLYTKFIELFLAYLADFWYLCTCLAASAIMGFGSAKLKQAWFCILGLAKRP